MPDATDDQQTHIRALGEELDAHRKARLALHPELTMTEMYNVLEKLRAGEALTAKEQRVHEKGLVSVLKAIHDELDAAVAAAYGWPSDLPDEEILERLVALNRERAEEERQGLVRYLRPEYQNPGGVQAELAVDVKAKKQVDGAATTIPWPDTLAAQAAAIRRVVASAPAALSVEEAARRFEHARLTSARLKKVAGLLETLEALGHVRKVGEGRYAV